MAGSRWKSLCAWLALACVLIGCASVEVAPADPNSGERCGIPFYLQRPYIVIEQEIPIEGREGYIAGKLTTQGNVFIQAKLLPPELRETFGEDNDLVLPITAIARLRPGQIAPVAGGTTGVGQTEGPRPRATETVDPNSTPSREEGDQEGAQEEYGTVASASGTMKWDSTVPQTLRENKAISVVFLPDLDEKYVAQTKAGLGTASLGVGMGPGSTVNVLQTRVDNREIGRFLFKQIDKFTDLAQKILAAKMGVAAGETLPALPAETEQEVLIPLKYVYVGFATPGMYPILKDSEYRRAAGRCLPNCWSEEDPFLRKAVWPYTRYSLRLRKSFAIYVEDNSPQKSTTAPSDAPTARALPQGFLDLRGFLEGDRGITVDFGSAVGPVRLVLDKEASKYPPAGGENAPPLLVFQLVPTGSQTAESLLEALASRGEAQQKKVLAVVQALAAGADSAALSSEGGAYAQQLAHGQISILDPITGPGGGG